MVSHTVAELLSDRVSLEVECIDRMYLNVYVPKLQFVNGVVSFLRRHRGHQFASSVLLEPISREFVSGIHALAEREGVPLISFKKGQRKDDLAQEYLSKFQGDEGILFIGRAQERVATFRTEKRRNPESGATYPWIVRASSVVNQFYVYAVDADFGPFFIKFSGYFPYNAKLCINGNEWAKRQATKAGIPFEPLDNGFSTCEQPRRLQRICDRLGAKQIDRLLRKWLRRLPHPFTPADRMAGYRYDISVLQAEFSLTQMLDRPNTGRIFFEEVIRENIDIGRPDRVSAIFDRRIHRTGPNRTPGRFRTRVFTRGVTPSLHVEYKSTRIKQYHKEGRALRTETTINDSYDFGIGRRLCNLPKLREVGFSANRRLLDVQRLSHDPSIGDQVFNSIAQPTVIDEQRVPALRFGDPRVHALLAAISVFNLQPRGFRNRDLRTHMASLLGLAPDDFSPGRMTYDLRRLRLHGLIERIPRTHRYRPTKPGAQVALFFTQAYNRFLRTGLSDLQGSGRGPIAKAMAQLEKEIKQLAEQSKLAA